MNCVDRRYFLKASAATLLSARAERLVAADVQQVTTSESNGTVHVERASYLFAWSARDDRFRLPDKSERTIICSHSTAATWRGGAWMHSKPDSRRGVLHTLRVFQNPEALVSIPHDGCPLVIRAIWLGGKQRWDRQGHFSAISPPSAMQKPTSVHW
jgi:hypothetical protein